MHVIHSFFESQSSATAEEIKAKTTHKDKNRKRRGLTRSPSSVGTSFKRTKSALFPAKKTGTGSLPC